ncbi:MAG: hypothetical protein ACYDCS_14165 [Candidatus Dormibacteria bacterium]
MIELPAPPEVTPPSGHVALRIHLFDRAGDELRSVIAPPWPRWVERLYELEEIEDPGIDLETLAVTASAALSALSERLHHRLVLLTWTLGVLEELGWEITQDGDSLIATFASTADAARAALENAGVAGALCRVCDIDDSGWPRLWANTSEDANGG